MDQRDGELMAAEFWQQWEDDVLASLYPSGGMARCIKALPDRTGRAIRSRARKLKLRLDGSPDPWTAVEDGLIRSLYADGGAAAVAEFMPNRSPSAIGQRACRLKVFNTASPFSKVGTGEPAVPLPAPHDYAPEDHAWMATRLPVYGGGFGAAVIGRSV